MNNRKIIYISHSHLTSKVRFDYYIDYLLSKNWSVEYWNLLPLLHGEIDEFGSQDADFLVTPKTYSDIEKMLSLKDNRNAIFVILINYGPKYILLYRLLTKYNCNIHFFAWGAYPHSKAESILKKMFLHLLNPFTLFKKIFNHINCVIHKKLKLVKPYDVVYCAGQSILKTFPDALKLVSVNTIDYDHYVRVKKDTKSLVNDSYAVFLDINLPFQSDLKIHNMPMLDPDEYFGSLNNFFELIEKKFRLKIVIAAHPKANYDNSTFKGRKIFRNLTPELVSKANFVLSHHSTSISYAVLNCKPIIFIYTSLMEKIYNKTCVEKIISFANFLESTVYDINKINKEEQISIKDVDINRYKDYKYSFLTSHNSEHTTMQDLFWNEINSD
jgi:hypothetical protein